MSAGQLIPLSSSIPIYQICRPSANSPFRQAWGGVADVHFEKYHLYLPLRKHPFSDFPTSTPFYLLVNYTLPLSYFSLSHTLLPLKFLNTTKTKLTLFVLSVELPLYFLNTHEKIKCHILHIDVLSHAHHHFTFIIPTCFNSLYKNVYTPLFKYTLQTCPYL
jgi:hypothetical protein